MPLTTTTTADSTLPELWSALTADEREQTLVVFNLFNRQFEAEAGKRAYDTIHIQGVNNFTTGALTLGVGGTVTYEAGAYATQINLVINTHAYQAFDLETEAELMSNINNMEKLSHKAGYSVALSMDDTAAGMVDDFSLNPVGQLAVNLDFEDYNVAARTLSDANVPKGDRSVILSPAERYHLNTIERFTNSLYSQAVGSISAKEVAQGMFAKGILGASWYESTNVEGSNAAGHDNGMFHKEVVATAVIDYMRKVEMYEIDTDSTKVVIHSIYGMIEVRENHGVFMRGA